jgi:hypothetical protein
MHGQFCILLFGNFRLSTRLEASAVEFVSLCIFGVHQVSNSHLLNLLGACVEFVILSHLEVLYASNSYLFFASSGVAGVELVIVRMFG